MTALFGHGAVILLVPEKYMQTMRSASQYAILSCTSQSPLSYWIGRTHPLSLWGFGGTTAYRFSAMRGKNILFFYLGLFYHSRHSMTRSSRFLLCHPLDNVSSAAYTESIKKDAFPCRRLCPQSFSIKMTVTYWHGAVILHM